MNVNLVLSMVFLMMIEICFGLNFDDAQLCVVCCMCLSLQAEYFPSHEDVLKLFVLTEEHFAREKKLRELG